MKKIMKIFFLSFVLMCFVSILTSCDSLMKDPDTGTTEPGDTNTPTETPDQKEAIYKLAVESGYTGTYEEWLESIKGDYIELSVTSTHIVWKYASESVWRNLIELSKLSGLQGTAGSNGADGKDGVDGKTPEFRVNAGYLEWKYTTDTNWIKLYEITTNSNTSSGNTTQDKTEYVTVTFVTKFELDEYDESVEDIKIVESVKKEVPVGNITEPTDILSEEETCYGWYYYDKYQGFVPWLFDAYYNSKDLVLYGDISVEYDVTYLDENGKVYEVLPVRENECAYDIDYEVKSDGYWFAGWTADGENVFDFNTLINCNITLRPLLREYGEGKVIELVYAGAPYDEELNRKLFEKFIETRRAEGDPNIYEIVYQYAGPDKVDSEVIDWGVGPDVYEFASDKMADLYRKDALDQIPSEFAKFIDEELNYFGQTCATFNGSYYAYPYTGDNTYYLQYDSSIISAEQAKSMIDVLDAAHAAGMKVGYNLGEGYWGAGAMFTFGADYDIKLIEDGNISSIDADFNSEKGLKAAKAILEIVNHPAFVNTADVPNAYNELAATIGGVWNIAPIKEYYGKNYACAVMPTVTVDGETRNLGAFLGGKLLGVNAQRAAGDFERLLAAHELAKFLSGYEAQMLRFELNNTVPCHNKAALEPSVLDYPNAAVLAAQGEFAHAQTAVPNGLWSAPYQLISAMINGECTLENLQTYIDDFNKTVVGQYYNEPLEPQPLSVDYYLKGSMNGWSDSEEYRLIYNESVGAYTLTVELEVGEEFKIATSDWAQQFNMHNTSYENGLFEEYTFEEYISDNFIVSKTGKYTFYIYVIDEFTHSCSIVLN